MMLGGLMAETAPCTDWMSMLSSHSLCYRYTTHVYFSDSAFFIFLLLSLPELPTNLSYPFSQSLTVSGAVPVGGVCVHIGDATVLLIEQQIQFLT